MGIADYFKPVMSMSAEEVREFLKDKNLDEYNLVDVRQPIEYEKGHIPGARLIPVGELSDHIQELDSDKPTITYCGSGVRSRAAASLLEGEGLRNVYSMQGGMRAWEGGVAEGAPDAGTAYFAPAGKPEEFIALAWSLEEGSRNFYAVVPSLVADEETKKLFRELATAEEHHKASLVNLYRTFTGEKPTRDFPESIIPGEAAGDIMEGGMRVSEALKWVKGKNLEAIFELALALETNSYDLYIRMRRQMKDAESREVFAQLSKEERRHLELLAELFERKV
jgi:sulfur-carrier protein adenylyltransferase/sulfurtransferase